VRSAARSPGGGSAGSRSTATFCTPRVDESNDSLRHRGGAWRQRSSAGQGRAGRTVAYRPFARRHHGGLGRRWPTRPTRGCWPKRCGRSRRAVAGFRPLVVRCKCSGCNDRCRSSSAAARPQTEASFTLAVLVQLGERGVVGLVLQDDQPHVPDLAGSQPGCSYRARLRSGVGCSGKCPFAAVSAAVARPMTATMVAFSGRQKSLARFSHV